MKNTVKALGTLVTLEDWRVWTQSRLDVTAFILHPHTRILDWIASSSDNLLNGAIPEEKLQKVVRAGPNQKAIEQMNRYTVRMLETLHKAAKADDPDTFQKVAKIITTKSKVFRYHIITTGIKDWNKLDQQTQEWLWCATDHILQTGGYEFKFHRVMIPKANGDMRPLAVPLKEWRAVSRWYLELFEIWIDPIKGRLINDYQFGGLKKRSAVDGWNRIWEKIVDAKYVAEFDITKCFDSVYHYQVEKNLIESMCPNFLNNFVIGVLTTAMNNLPVEIQKIEAKEMMDRNDQEYTPILHKISSWTGKMWNKVFSQDTIERWRKDTEREWNWGLAREYNRKNKERNEKIRSPGATWDPKRGNTIPRDEWPNAAHVHEAAVQATVEGMCKPTGNLWDDVAFTSIGMDLNRGLPQGWNFSPMLANMALRDTIPHTAVGVLYLDDGVIAAESPEAMDLPGIMTELRGRGFTLAPAKFKWIKWDGEWINKLKFLGLETDGSVMQAATRKGANIKWGIPTLARARQEGSTGNEWNKKENLKWIGEFKDRPDRLPLDDAQIAYLYNNGGTYDSNGKWVPMEWDQMWKNALKSKRMKLWGKSFPERMDPLLQGISEFRKSRLGLQGAPKELPKMKTSVPNPKWLELRIKAQEAEELRWKTFADRRK